MTRPGHSDYTTPQIGDTVTHPLWPELGTGLVLTTGTNGNPGVRCGRIRWSTGQESSHCLGILHIVPTPLNPSEPSHTDHERPV